jgi:ATP-dependent DNA helicase RecG
MPTNVQMACAMADRAGQLSVGEGERLDRKSLRAVTERAADFSELAKDCVCFANGCGGQLLIGIEDVASGPPPDQRVPRDLLDRIRKRVGELTVNVDVAAEVRTGDSGGEYIVLTVARAVGVASTSDGRYFLRVGDNCRPVVGDDVLRLVTERLSVPWETMTSLRVPRARADAVKRERLCAALRASDRV